MLYFAIFNTFFQYYNQYTRWRQFILKVMASKGQLWQVICLTYCHRPPKWIFHQCEKYIIVKCTNYVWQKWSQSLLGSSIFIRVSTNQLALLGNYVIRSAAERFGTTFIISPTTVIILRITILNDNNHSRLQNCHCFVITGSWLVYTAS